MGTFLPQTATKVDYFRLNRKTAEVKKYEIDPFLGFSLQIQEIAAKFADVFVHRPFPEPENPRSRAFSTHYATFHRTRTEKSSADNIAATRHLN